MRSLLVLAALAGCGRIDFDTPNTLVVTTTVDRMAGPSSIASIDDLPAGVTDLSLREALAIASNHRGADRVEFDLSLFPTSTPVAILVSSPLVVPADTEVDARVRGVILDAAPGYTGTLVRVAGDDTRVLGLILQGATDPRIEVDTAARAELVALDIRAAAGIGVHITNARTATLRDSVIDGAAANAVQIERSTDVTIERTTITATLGDPISIVSSTSLLIRDNTILIDPAATGRGIVLDQVSGSRILDNFIDPGSAQLIRLDNSAANEIIGNILDRGDVAVALFGTSTDNLVFRNVVVSNPEPLYVADTATGNRLLHNTLYMCGSIVDSAPDTELTNNLEADTGFADPATFDFRLVAPNPAIDAGTDTGLDLLPDRDERFLGDAPDLGAIETM